MYFNNSLISGISAIYSCKKYATITLKNDIILQHIVTTLNDSIKDSGFITF
jgi:hypothetical protein